LICSSPLSISNTVVPIDTAPRLIAFFHLDSAQVFFIFSA
jgi:hypothetical protein